MSNSGRSSPAPRSTQQTPLLTQMSSSPGTASSFRARSFVGGASVPRAESTARLAMPLPYQGTPPQGGMATPRSATVTVDNSSESNANASTADSLTPLAGPGSPIRAAGPGVSALAAALSNSIGSSPPRFGTPPVRSTSPFSTAAAAAAAAAGPFPPLSDTPTTTNYGSFDTRARYAQNTSGGGGGGAYEDPEIVKRHLVQPSDTTSDDAAGGLRKTSGGGDGAAGSKGKQPDEPGGGGGGGGADDEFSSLQLQGGDITRPIYKWTEEAEQRKVQRSQSFSMPRPEPEHEVLDINSIKVPGGFRRNFLRRAVHDPSSASGGELGFGGEGSGRGAAHPPLFTSSFLEFLTIYGHFAGEELEEDDEVLKPGEYFPSGAQEYYDSDDSDSDDSREPMEDSTLLTPSRRKRRRKERGGSGQNTPTGAALLLLKSFVGTGVLFLPRAYLNGGMLFSNLVLLFVAVLSYYCFVLLVTTRLRVEGSFGDIGGVLYGRWLRNLILASIVLSQVGFVAAYIVFTSKNLQAFILAVTDCRTEIGVQWLILMQMVIFLPFSLLRDISKLGFTALIADAFIVVGLAYLFYYDVLELSTHGLADIILFNSKDWTLFIGTAIFTFEGIGLIIPIQESMKNPKKFPGVMLAVMVIITALFTVMGAVSYAAYGSRTETVVLLNLPQDDRLVNGVQFLYSLAILLSTPLQIFPAIRITENALFTRSGKYNPYIKWQKNGYRFLVVAVCALIAWGGADDLDKFVALVGNFACIPLVYIYPPMLHYRGVARNPWWKASDVVLCIFGFVAMAYTTSLTVMSWAGGTDGGDPSYCDRRRGGGGLF